MRRFFQWGMTPLFFLGHLARFFSRKENIMSKWQGFGEFVTVEPSSNGKNEGRVMSVGRLADAAPALRNLKKGDWIAYAKTANRSLGSSKKVAVHYTDITSKCA